MTRTGNARLAGLAFLICIGAGIAQLILSTGAPAGEGVAARLANVATHSADLRVPVLLSLLGSFAALVLGVSMYVLTRAQDADLALMGLECRAIEAIPGVSAPLALLWLSDAAAKGTLDGVSVQVLGAYLLRGGGTGAIFFAVGSMLFAWLLLRGGMIPAALAWLGVLASALLVLVLPLDLAGLLRPSMGWSGASAWLLWLPMLVYELGLAAWLIAKGAAVPVPAGDAGKRF